MRYSPEALPPPSYTPSPAVLSRSASLRRTSKSILPTQISLHGRYLHSRHLLHAFSSEHINPPTAQYPFFFFLALLTSWTLLGGDVPLDVLPRVSLRLLPPLPRLPALDSYFLDNDNHPHRSFLPPWQAAEQSISCAPSTPSVLYRSLCLHGCPPETTPAHCHWAPSELT